MSNWQDLKNQVATVIYDNNAEEITGALDQSIRHTVIDALGDYHYAGVAIPSTNPGNPDGKVFYTASEAGSYTNFGVTVNENEFCFIRGTGGTWTKYVVLDLSSFTGGGQIIGKALEATNPGTPTGEVYYFAEEGSYPNFGGGFTVSEQQLALFKYSPATTLWENIIIYDPTSVKSSGAGRVITTSLERTGFKGIFRVSNTIGAVGVTFDANVVKVTVNSPHELYHFAINDESSNYNENYAEIELIHHSNAINQDSISICPPVLRLISRDGTPTDNAPFQYTNGKTNDVAIDITVVSAGVIRIKINNINAFGSFTLVGSW